MRVQDRTKVTIKWLIGSCIRPFDWCQNQRPWMTFMTLKGHYPLRFITRASFGAHHENLNEDRRILSDDDVSQWLLDSGNTKFMWIMRIFAGVPWKGVIIQQWGNRKRGLSGFRTLRLRYLRKWGQHYYVVLFSPLSPFNWPQIHDLVWPFYAQFSLLRTAFQRLCYVTSWDVRERTVKTVIRRILRIRERIANLL